MIFVYTVITGEYDKLRPPWIVEDGVRYVCFSDRPHHCPPWEIQGFPQCFGNNPRHNSRIPKMLPHLLLDCHASIYHDGAFRIQRPPSKIVSEWLLSDSYDIAMVRHPVNRSFREEAGWDGVSQPSTPEQRQAEAITNRGLVLDGCWAAGLIVRRHNAATARLGEVWMREYRQGTPNDQISLIPALVESGVLINTIDQDVLACREASYHLHADSNCQDNIAFAEERDAWRGRVGRIWEICK